MPFSSKRRRLISTCATALLAAAGTGVAVAPPAAAREANASTSVPSATLTVSEVTWPLLTTAMIGSAYDLTVPISGATKAGQVCGWIDFDKSGTFAEPVEQACASFAAGAPSATLSWTVPTQTAAGLTHARLRAAYRTVTGPTGPEDSGEVEDHALTIMPTVVVKKRLPSGTSGTFDLAVNGTTVAAKVGNGGTSGTNTVGQSTVGSTVTKPDITVTQDVDSAPIPLTVTESGTAGNTGSYTTTYTCLNGAGTPVARGTGTSISTGIPASARGTSADGREQSITCTFTNTGSASLTLVKSASPTTVTAAGQTVNYAFLVTNTGNTTVSGVGIDDTLTAPAGPAASITCPAPTLAPTGRTTCTATYTVTQADIDNGTIDNSATASGTPPTGPAATSSRSTATVNASPAPSLTLVTSADPSVITVIGEPVAYSFLVSNTGNATLTGITIDDVLAAPAGPALVISCAATTLAPAAQTTCTATYTSTAADFGKGVIDNTAAASGTSPQGAKITSGPSGSTVDAIPSRKLTVVMSASPTTVTSIGQRLSYAILITNTGDVTITDISPDDTLTAPAGPALSISCPATTLAVGASTTCIAGYTSTAADFVNGTITNTMTVSGTPPNGPPVTSDPSSVTVTALAR